MSIVTERMLDVHQAAKLAGVHVETLRRSIRKGQLPAVRNTLKPGGPLLVSESAVLTWAQQRSAMPSSEV